MKKVAERSIIMAWRLAVLPLCLAMALSAKAQGADFNCKKPQSAFEHLACGEIVTTIQGNDNGLMATEQRELEELDDELNAVYKEAMAKHFDPALLRREQRAWLKARERCAQDDYCGVSVLYRDRIDNLRYDLTHPPQSEADRKSSRLLSMGSPPGDNFVFSREARPNGFGLGLCEALVRWLNYTTPKGDVTDESDIRATRMPGLSYPAWQELDMQKHLDLFAKIVEFDDHGTLTMPLSPFAQKQIEAARMGQVRLWMVKEDVNRLSEGKPETLVTYDASGSNDTSRSQDGEHRVLGSSPIVVTDDLRDVDIQTTHEMLGNGALRYYKGKPYFVSIGENLTSTHSPFFNCEINRLKLERS